MTTKDEHLAYAKARALEYLEPGPYHSPMDAMKSFSSDLTKQDETRAMMTPAAMKAMLEVMLGNAAAVRQFIEGFGKGGTNEQGVPREGRPA